MEVHSPFTYSTLPNLQCIFMALMRSRRVKSKGKDFATYWIVSLAK